MTEKPLFTRKPSRKQLLEALGKCQDLFGKIEGAYQNDRAHDRAGRVVNACRAGFDLCIAALEWDPPQ